MKEFQTWREARDYAECQVRATGIAHGIEKPTYVGKGKKQTKLADWVVRMLPRKENRCGFELRCEAVEP